MAKTWSDFANSPAYQSLSDNEKQAAQQHYYENYVYPNVAGTDQAASARDKFLREVNPTLTDRALDVGAKAVSGVADLAKRGISALSNSDFSNLNFDPVAVAQQRQIEQSRSVTAGRETEKPAPVAADPLVRQPDASESMQRILREQNPPALDSDIQAGMDDMAVQDFKERGWLDEQGETTASGMVAKTIAERGVGLGQTAAFTGLPGTDEAELSNRENIGHLLDARKQSDDTLGTASYSLVNGETDRAFDYLKQNAAAGAVDAAISTLGIFIKPLRLPSIVTQGASEGGNTYRASLDAGMSEEAALGRGAFQALTASLTEIVGFAGADFLLGKLAKMAPKAQAELYKKALASTAKAAGTVGAVSFDEGGEEVFNSIANDLADQYGFSKLDMNDQARAGMQNPDILGNASESFVAGALGGAVASPVSAGASVMQDMATLKAEQAINGTLNTDQHQMLDDDQLASMRDVAEQVNGAKPGAVDTGRIDAEIQRRADLGTLARADEAGQRARSREAIDATELYGADPATITHEGITDVGQPTDAIAGVVDQPAQAEPDNALGGMADLPVQPDAGADRGRLDNATEALAPGGGSDLSTGTAEQGGDAVTPQTAKVGDVVDMGGAKFRKTENGFERVDVNESEANSVVSQIPQDIDANAHAAATSPLNDMPEPTEAQKEAGNYKKGKTSVAGLNISIENPQGSVRSGTDKSGKAWQTTMQDHYGYITGVPAKASDKDHVDTFIKAGTPQDYAGDVYVVDQSHPGTDSFDEPKVMIGYTGEQEANAAYHRNYQDGWKGMRQITRMSMDEFKAKLQDEAAFTKPQPGAVGSMAAAKKELTKAQIKGDKAGVQAARAKIAELEAGEKVSASSAHPVIARVGNTPKASEPITIRDGIIHIGDSPAVDYETGEDVRATGSTLADVKKDLANAQALSSKQKIYSPGELAGTKVSKADAEQVHAAEPKADQLTGNPSDYEGEHQFDIALDDGQVVNVAFHGTKSDKNVARGPGYVHIEFRGKAISSSGYRSHFTGISDKSIPLMASIKAIAEEFAVEHKKDAQKEAKKAKAESAKQAKKGSATHADERSAQPGQGLQPASKAEPVPAEAVDDRDHFTVERLNRETNQMEPFTFERGEYVRFQLSGKDTFGEIDGISHAEHEFSVDGLWYPFGFAYKAEKPAEAVKPTVSLSSVIDDVNEKHGTGLGYADRIHTLDVHADLFKRVYDGEATAGEFKAAFDSLLNNKAGIVAELDAISKAAIFKLRPGLEYRYKSEKKADLVEAAYRDMITDFVLSDSLSYGMGKNSMENAVRAIVDRATDESLAKFASSVKRSREERAEQNKEAEAGMENPETLEDYQRIMSAKAREIGDGATFAQARMAMSPEQRARFDELAAEKSRSQRAARKDAKQQEFIRAPGEAVATTDIIQTKHTKHGHDLWQFAMEQRVSPDEFKSLVAQAKRLAGDYSSYRGNGAIPGWQFRSEEGAKAFKALVAGDTTEAKEVMQARRDAFADDRSQSAVERLNEMADSLEEKADASLGQERKANTARRARFAASAEAAANAEKAMARTMRNIASAIEDGSTKSLGQTRQKVQVETLQGFVRTAQSDMQQKLYPEYVEREKHSGEAPTPEVADYVTFPAYTAFRSDLASLGRALLETDGTIKLGQRIMKVADDVSDVYLKFAKDNIDKVGVFRTQSGERAVFTSKPLAEESIIRSGFRGTAIALPFKRGENLIVLSPSEAIKRGIWQGDHDKRITLDPELGAELVEKIGKAARRGAKISVPWQFDNAYDKRKRLAGMGIETPAELRAALREFIGLREAPPEADKIKQMERAMIGRKNDGLDFFPTPASVADEMIEAAGIQEGMSVLEPSAGMGHIAERIRAAGVDPDVVELANDRMELLEAKGFNVVGRDFMDIKPREFFTFGDTFKSDDGTEGIMRGSGSLGSGRVRMVDASGEQIGYFDRDELTPERKNGRDSGYDRIIMNPPFGDRRDAVHVQHAYELLKPGGRMVAIMGEGVFFGQDKKAQEFRTWLDERGATDEKLEEGTFLDPSLPVNTGVNARMVVIDKPADSPAFSRDQSHTETPEPRATTDDKLTNTAMSSVYGAGLPIEATQAIVDAVGAKWDNAPQIIVVNDMDDSRIRKTLREENERRLSQGATGQPEGFFDAGKVYIVASEMSTPQHVVRVLLHESLGHYGLRGVFGDDLAEILDQIYMARRKEVLAKAKQYGLDFTKQADRRRASEEVLSVMAQTHPQIGFVKRAVAAIRTWLRDTFPQVFGGIKLSDTEIIRDYLEPARVFVIHGAKKDVSGEADFARGNREVGGNDTYLTAALEMAARHPELFEYPTPESKTVEGAAAEIDPGLKVEKVGGSTAREKGADRAWDLTVPSSKVRSGVIYEKGSKVWIDVSRLQAGKDFGSMIYAVAAAYAHENGKVFEGDPGGLSRKAFYRRTENMLSSALKYGTTRHLRPHDAQVNPLGYYGQENFDFASSVRPVNWIDGDDLNNLKELIYTAYKSAVDNVPEIKNVTFNAQSSQFEYADGRPFTREDRERMAAELAGKGSPYSAGSRTLKRAAFYNTFLREQSKEARRQVLGGLRDQLSRDGLASELNRVMYSRGSTSQQKKTKQGGMLDRTLQTFGGKLLAEKITKPLYGQAARLMDSKYLLGSKAGAVIKAGIVADYGLDQQYLDRRDEIEARMNAHLRAGKTLIQKLGGLSREESRIAYQWLQEKPDSVLEDELLAQLPKESRAHLEAIKQMIDDMSQEAIALGQLTPEQYERNRYAYLHRSYTKHEFTDDVLENKIVQLERMAQDAASDDERKRLQREIGALKLNRKTGAQRTVSRKILGDQYRGRGMQFLIPPERLDTGKEKNPLEVGQKYIRLERRDADGALVKRVWWNSAVPVPPLYGDMEADPVAWEVRGTKNGKVILWRDFTKEERERMGELDEAKYAVASTVSKMAHDIEIGKFFSWVNGSYAQDEPPDDAVIVDNASDSAWSKGNLIDALAEGAWVKVPDTKVPTTQVARYGALAGKYVPGSIWNDIRQIANPPSVPRWYQTIMRYWKIAKTALSPAVHFNNVMANVVMADMHDVQSRHVVRALETLWKARKEADAKTFMERFEDSGAIAGTYVHAELKDDMMKPLLEELRREMIGTQSALDQMHTVANAMAMIFGQREIRKGMTALSHTAPGKWAAKLPEVMIETYQNEDVVFRLAAFIKATDEGKTDREAGKDARKAFLDYRINAPWIQGLRHTVLPFIAFTYRMIPMYVETMRDKPWKMAKYMMVANTLAAAGMALAGIGDDEDDEIQRLLPDDRKGLTPYLTQRQIPVGRTDDGRPVYLDVTRWMPLGDIFEVRGESSNVLPLPGFIYPSGVIMLASEAFANRSFFSGRDIWQSTDTAAEMSSKLFNHIYKGMAPNFPVLPGTYSFDKIEAAYSGKIDMMGREYSIGQALASSIGVKLNSYDTDMLRFQAVMDAESQIMEIRGNMRRTAREYGRNGMTKDELNDKLEGEGDKLRGVAEGLQERVN